MKCSNEYQEIAIRDHNRYCDGIQRLEEEEDSDEYRLLCGNVKRSECFKEDLWEKMESVSNKINYIVDDARDRFHSHHLDEHLLAMAYYQVAYTKNKYISFPWMVACKELIN